MTEGKSRKKNLQNKTAAKAGEPRAGAGQAPDASPVDISPDEAVISGQSEPPAQTVDSDATLDHDGSWRHLLPGGLTALPLESQLGDDTLAHEQTFLEESGPVAPAAFPGGSSSWQTAIGSISLGVPFPGGYNPAPDGLPEDRLAAPFPGGLNPPLHEEPESAIPLELPDSTSEWVAADANSHAQSSEAIPSPTEQSTSSAGNRLKPSKRQKK